MYFEWQIKDTGQRLCIVDCKSGLNVCLRDKSYILWFDSKQKRTALFLVLGNVFYRLLIMGNHNLIKSFCFASQFPLLAFAMIESFGVLRSSFVCILDMSVSIQVHFNSR